MLIALTGGSGFIGSRLCERLGGAGHRVRTLSRSGHAPAGIEAVRGDLASTEALGSLVAGADAVIHLAASVRGASAADFDRPNVDGTVRLLDALDAHAPATPLLLLSSLAAREPALSWYAASKRRAEDAVRTRCARRPCLVLRPPAVYGPGDREMLPVFRFMAHTGLAPCAGSPGHRLSLIHVDDLVDAIVAWLAERAGAIEPVAIHDGTPRGYDWHELAAIAGRVCGRSIRVWRIPAPLLDAVASINLATARVLRRLPMLTPAKLRELRHADWVVEDRAVAALGGWQPTIRLEQGLSRTPGWF